MTESTIKHIQDLGFSVYMRHPTTDYLIYSDGDHIASFEKTHFGYAVSTIHRPNPTTGTGYRMCATSDTPTRAELTSGFVFAPEWACGAQLATISKYRGITEYWKRGTWQAEHKLVDQLTNKAAPVRLNGRK